MPDNFIAESLNNLDTKSPLPMAEFIVKETPVSSDVKDWLGGVNQLFFKRLEEYDQVWIKEKPELAANRKPEKIFSGYNCCEPAARLLGEAIKRKFKLPPENVRFVRGWVDKNEVYRMLQYPEDGWLKIIGFADGAVFVHPTIGQFKEEYIQKILCDKLEKEKEYGVFEDSGKEESVDSTRSYNVDTSSVDNLPYISWLEQTMGERIAKMYVTIVDELVNFDPAQKDNTGILMEKSTAQNSIINEAVDSK